MSPYTTTQLEKANMLWELLVADKENVLDDNWALLVLVRNPTQLE